MKPPSPDRYYPRGFLLFRAALPLAWAGILGEAWSPGTTFPRTPGATRARRTARHNSDPRRSLAPPSIAGV
jgi:hypothetical protein